MITAENIRDFVSKRGDNVTFMELGQLPGFKAEEGEEGFEFGKLDVNWVFWHGLSRAGCDAIKAAVDAGYVHWHPTTYLTYLIDGGMLRMPIVKRAHTYKKPHWMPVVLKLGPTPKPKAKRRKAA